MSYRGCRKFMLILRNTWRIHGEYAIKALPQNTSKISIMLNTAVFRLIDHSATHFHKSTETLIIANPKASAAQHVFKFTSGAAKCQPT